MAAWTQSKLAAAMQKAWFDASDEECHELAEKLSAFVGCNPHTLWTALTNLPNVCWREEDAAE